MTTTNNNETFSIYSYINKNHRAATLLRTGGEGVKSGTQTPAAYFRALVDAISSLLFLKIMMIAAVFKTLLRLPFYPRRQGGVSDFAYLNLITVIYTNIKYISKDSLCQ